MENSQKVTLSDGKVVVVGKLNWKGYKAVKSLIAKTVSGPILRELTSVLNGPASEILGDLLNGIVGCVGTGDAAATAQANLAQSLTDKWGAAQTASLVVSSIDRLKVSIANVLQEVLTTSDDFTELLIGGTVSEKIDVATVGVEDVAALRDAALDLNDLGKLLDLEKNWLGRVAKSGQALIGSPT